MHSQIKHFWIVFVITFIAPSIVCAQEIIHIEGDGDVSEKTALVILNGFGDSRKNRKKQTEFFESLDYDFFIPKYKNRKSLDGCVKNFTDFYEDQNLQQYKEVSVICYIIGGYVLNRHIENEGMGNIKTIIYDRSPIQERAPNVAADKIKLISILMIGKVIVQFSEADKPNLESAKGVKVGLIIENKATPLMRLFHKASDSYGPYDFYPYHIDPNLDDYFHTILNHDEMYFRFEQIGSEIEYFLEKGSFTSGARRDVYEWDMFEKLKD